MTAQEIRGATRLAAPRSEVRASAPAMAPGAQLAALLALSPTLGVRRLTLLAWQLASELELAASTGVTPGRIAAETVRIENAGTPFERARLPLARQQADAPEPRSGLCDLGLLLQRLLADKPLYLEESVWMPPQAGARVLRRRADAEVLHSIGRALSLIARRCIGSQRTYRAPSELVQDLNRLAQLVGRIVACRRAAPPVVRLCQPRPATPADPRLPSVVVA